MSQLIITTRLWSKGMQDLFIPLTTVQGEPLYRAALFERAETLTAEAMLKRLRGVDTCQVRRLACRTGYRVETVVDLLLSGNSELAGMLEGMG